MAAASLIVASRCYRGPVKAVIFDFAGTIVDHGSLAPVGAFREVFKQHGVEIDVATARGPMGKNKRDHISEILYSKDVAAKWAQVHGKAPSEADVDSMYVAFTPIQVEVVKQRCDPIPGAVQTMEALRKRGKIGGNSGYNRPIMEALLAGAEAKGLHVDAWDCAGPNNGRPKPWMSTSVAEKLDVYPLCACVKVDDTIPGITEGLGAGMWTVGLARSGNELGLDQAEADALQRERPDEYAARIDAARKKFAAAGAHFVIDSVADLLPVIEAIEREMARGNTPLA